MGRVCSMELWDTAGPEEYSRLRRLSYPGTSCFLMTYSVVSQTSYANIMTKWIPEVQETCPLASILLVGTKIDLRAAPLPPHMDAPLSKEHGEQLVAQASKRWPGLRIRYVECSSLTGLGLKAVFGEAMSLSLAVEGKSTSQKEEKCIVC
jgi:small GTP-binding protein